LAIDTRSGLIPKCWKPNHWPNRPKPQITSSLTSRIPYRLADEGGDVFRPHLQDARLDRARRALGEQLRVLAMGFAKQIGLHHMFDAGNGEIALSVHHLHAAEAHARDGRAMIGVPAADEDLALRLTFQLPIMADQAKHRVVGFRT
jgi:hypothetical protein